MVSTSMTRTKNLQVNVMFNVKVFATQDDWPAVQTWLITQIHMLLYMHK